MNLLTITEVPNDCDILAILSPTDKWGTKTEYARLRNFLLKDGYIRIGPEVFMRVVQNRKASEKHYRRIDEVKPKTVGVNCHIMI